MPTLQQHLDKIESMRHAAGCYDGEIIDPMQDYAETLRDVGASILNSIDDLEKGIESETDSLMQVLYVIGEKGLYQKFGYGRLDEFVKTEYASFKNVHYALRQVYAIDKLLIPLSNGLIPPPVTDDGEIVTVEYLLENSAESTISRAAQVPAFNELSPEQKTSVVLDIANGKSRDKVVGSIHKMKDTSLDIECSIIENEDGTSSMVFPSLNRQQVAFIQGSLGRHVNVNQQLRDVIEWARKKVERYSQSRHDLSITDEGE